MLSNLGKILERVICNKMDNHINNSFDVIPEYQFGFKKSHSTTHALIKVHNDITINLRKKKCTVACCLDVEKAFDSVWVEGLLFKLIEIGFPIEIFKILLSFLSDRSLYIMIQNIKSEVININRGVPQGSVLGPRLYNIFMYDFPHINTFRNSSPTKGLLFADDTIILAHADYPHVAVQKLSKHIDLIVKYYAKWGIKINISKSEAICFRNSCSKGKVGIVVESKNVHLKVDNVEVPFKNKIKYLGVQFSNLLKFNIHARKTKEKAIKVTNMLTPYLRHQSLQKSTKLLFYKTLIRPIMIYAFPCWFTISPTVAKELEIRFVYNETQVKPLMSYAFVLMKKFVERMSWAENDLVKDIYEQQKDISWDSSIYLSPVGIICENEEINLECALPSFYQRSVQGQNRG